MPEQNNGGSGSLTSIVSETAETARRLALETIKKKKKGEYRSKVYQKIISEKLKEGDDQGAIGLIQGLENDFYCQSMGYLLLRRYYHGKSEIGRAREMIELSLEKARNAGAEKDELCLQIVDAKFTAKDIEGVETLINDIKDPYYQSKACVSLSEYQFSKKQNDASSKNLDSATEIARRIKDNGERAEVLHRVISIRLRRENGLKETLELAYELPKGTHYRNMSFAEIIHYKLGKNNLDKITELIDEIEDKDKKADIMTEVIEKEIGTEDKQRLIARIKEIEDPRIKGRCLAELSSKELRRRNFDAAESAASEIENKWFRSQSYSYLLVSKLGKNDIPKAEELLGNIKEDIYRAQSLALLARAYHDQGEKDTAKTKLEETIRFTKEETRKHWIDDLFKGYIIPIQIHFEDFDGALASIPEIDREYYRSNEYIKLSLIHTKKEEFLKAVDVLKLAFGAAKEEKSKHWKAERLLDVKDTCNKIIAELKEKGEPIPPSLLEMLEQLGQEA